jgi:hypothetical protein
LPFSPFRQKWCDICAQPGWADAGIMFVSIAVAWPRSERLKQTAWSVSQPWFYLRLLAEPEPYSFIGLSERAYGSLCDFFSRTP